MKHIHTEGSGSILQSRFARGVVPLVATLLACATAQAELLLYDGFATETDDQNRAAYSTAADKCKLQSNNAKSVAWTTGLSASNPWSDSSAAVYTFPNNGLSLPAAFTGGTGDQFTARGGSAGWQDSSSPGENRAKNRAIVSTMPTTGTLWYRCVMLMEQNAYNVFKTGTKYSGTGLSAHAAENKYDNGSTLASEGFRVYFVGNATDGQHVQLRVRVGSSYATLIESIAANTAYICILGIDYDTGKACAYAAPVADYDESFTWTAQDLDASSITGSAIRTMYLDGPYQTGTGRVRFDEIAAGTKLSDVAVWSSATAPKLRDGSLSFANGTYTASAFLTNSAANVSYVLSNGTTATTNAIAAFDNGDTVAGTFAAPTDDTTYEVLLVAKNQGGETGELSLGTIYGGTLSLTKASDASELGLVPAALTVARAGADPLPLVVNYAFADGTAVAGTNYVDDAGSVTIPAGQASATIAVHPLVDVATAADTAMSVFLAAGHYTAPAAVSVTIENFTTPAGQNYWIGGTATDGAYLASTAANWSAGHAPLANENVIFDGNFSNANCEWDSAASATVASWTQTNGYSGTVTVDTVFPEKGAFTVLTVTGDMAIRSGSVTHREHTATYKVDQYRLRIDVGGNLTVASGAKITARAKGSYDYRTDAAGAYGGSYDGAPAWGSLTEPYEVGSSANDYGVFTCRAGGAIWIEVTGATTLDGTIDANGIMANDKFGNTAAGSGGAIYLKTATLSGSGKVSANCENEKRGSNSWTAAGGRVSILLTAGEFSSFPDANVTAWAGNTSYSHVGGVGTVLVRTPQKPNGVLYLRDRSGKYGQYGYRPKPNQLTRIPAGQTWVVDGIVFGENAILEVPTGTTLDLRGGLASVSSTGNTLDETGLIVDGGTLLLPSAATHTISGKWIFEPKDFALAGNLVVTNGAGVGTLLLYSTTSNEVRTCGLSVSGDAHVASGAYLRAVRGGYIATGTATPGGTLASCHGGTRAASTTASRSYDSFFRPRHPGAFGADNGLVNVGGGAIRLAVGGTLTLDGVAIATPSVNNARCGAAGSIDITAARLEGAGRIEANGNSRNYTAEDSSSAGGGGRVAVRLTGTGETFSDAWIAKINAKGYYSSKITATYSSSAGSVYLQTAAQGEGAGTIIIRNTGDTANNVAVTELPSLKAGGEEDDFRKASLSVEAAARVQLFADLRMAKLEMEADTVLDLNGKTLTVKSATINGVKLATGTYTAESTVEIGEGTLGDDYLVDTAEGAGGELVVKGVPFVVIVR